MVPNCSLFTCWLIIISLHLKAYRMKKGQRINFKLEKSGKYDLSCVIKITINMTSHVVVCILGKMAFFLNSHSSVSSLPQSTSEKALVKSQLRNILRNILPIILKILKAFKNEKYLRKSKSQQELKETW